MLNFGDDDGGEMIPGAIIYIVVVVDPHSNSGIMVSCC